MDVFLYTALKNRRGASRIVSDHNMRPADSPNGLASQLAYCVRKHGKSAMHSIALAHPDRGLFRSECDERIKQALAKEKEAMLNANGQSMKNDVQGLRNEIASDKRDNTMVIGAMVIIALALILRK